MANHTNSTDGLGSHSSSERWPWYLSVQELIDDIMQRKRFSHYWPFVFFDHRCTPFKGPVMLDFDVSLMLAPIYCWTIEWLMILDAVTVRQSHWGDQTKCWSISNKTTQGNVPWNISQHWNWYILANALESINGYISGLMLTHIMGLENELNSMIIMTGILKMNHSNAFRECS